MQKLTQLIRIRLLTSGFLENFGSESQFPRGGMSVFPPCGRPCRKLSVKKFRHRYHRQGRTQGAWGWTPT